MSLWCCPQCGMLYGNVYTCPVCGVGTNSGMTSQDSFGLPPFAPLRRAAAALASLVRPLFACPPFRPSATACGFLRGTASLAGVVRVVLRIAFDRIGAVARAVVAEVQAVDAGFPCGEGFSALALGGDLVSGGPQGLVHGRNNTDTALCSIPLWVVK